MNDIYVEAFKNQTFYQNGNESAILEKKYYKPPNLMFNFCQLKISKSKKRMRNGYIAVVSTSLDIQENI